MPFSPYANPYKTQLNTLYQNVANRDVDDAGLKFYSDHLANGADWGQLQQSITADFARQAAEKNDTTQNTNFSSYVNNSGSNNQSNTGQQTNSAFQTYQQTESAFRPKIDDIFLGAYNRPADQGKANFFKDKMNTDGWTWDDVQTYVNQDAQTEAQMQGHDAMSTWSRSEMDNYKQSVLDGLSLSKTGTKGLYNAPEQFLDGTNSAQSAASTNQWDQYSDDQFIELINPAYQEAFGRDADYDGAMFWKNTGQDLSQIQNRFLSSPERTGLESDYESFRNDATSALSDYAYNINNLGIGDVEQAEQLKYLLYQMQSGIGQYDNTLADQLGGFGDIMDQINSLNPTVENIFTQTKAEQDRISQFERGIVQKAQDVRNQLSDLDPWDIDGAKALRRELQDLEGSAYGFNSELNFDFSDEFSQAGNAGNDLNQFLSNYNSMNQSRLSSLDNLSRTIMGGNIYNAGNFDMWDNQLGQLARGDDVSFQQNMIQALRDQRAQKMDGFSSKLSDLGSGIDSIELTDITGLDKRRNDLRNIESQLSMFQGGRAPDMMSQLEEYMSGIEGRFDQRTSRRNEINDAAELMLNTVQDGQYDSLDQLDPLREQLSALRGDVSSFDVFNAEDELAKLASLLSGYEGTIEERRLQAEQEAEQSAMYANAPGNVRFMMPGAMSGTSAGYLNDQQIMAMMRAAEDEKTWRSSYNPGTFAQNVIRV